MPRMSPLLGIVGLGLGAGLYFLISLAPQPLERFLYLAFYLALGAGVALWGKGDRTVQIVGGVIAVYGVVRTFLL